MHGVSRNLLVYYDQTVVQLVVVVVVAEEVCDHLLSGVVQSALAIVIAPVKGFVTSESGRDISRVSEVLHLTVVLWHVF